VAVPRFALCCRCFLAAAQIGENWLRRSRRFKAAAAGKATAPIPPRMAEAPATAPRGSASGAFARRAPAIITRNQKLAELATRMKNSGRNDACARQCGGGTTRRRTPGCTQCSQLTRMNYRGSCCGKECAEWRESGEIAALNTSSPTVAPKWRAKPDEGARRSNRKPAAIRVGATD